MQTIGWLIVAYLVAGNVFAVLFLGRGAARIDDAAHGISYFTKTLLFTGSTVFWPFLLKKWLKTRRNPPAIEPEP